MLLKLIYNIYKYKIKIVAAHKIINITKNYYQPMPDTFSRLPSPLGVSGSSELVHHVVHVVKSLYNLYNSLAKSLYSLYNSLVKSSYSLLRATLCAILPHLNARYFARYPRSRNNTLFYIRIAL